MKRLSFRLCESKKNLWRVKTIPNFAQLLNCDWTDALGSRQQNCNGLRSKARKKGAR
jgi:hypothetical protein